MEARRPLHTLLFLVLLALAAACSSKGSADTPAHDGGGDALHPADGGSAEGGAFTPAFKPDMGQITTAGGKRLASPKIITVTWDGDTNRAGLEDFGDQLTTSAYWKATTAEYGIGTGTSGVAGHLRVTGTPPGPDPLAISDYLRTQLAAAAPIGGGAPSGWPVPDASSIYVVYIPSSVKMSPSTTKHSELTVGSSHVAYVLVDEGGHDAQ